MKFSDGRKNNVTDKDKEAHIIIESIGETIVLECQDSKRDLMNKRTFDRLKKSAMKGVRKAQLKLSHVYIYGNGCVERDYKLAIYWMRQLVEQNNIHDDKLMLGILLLDSQHGEVSNQEGVYWLKQAEAQGSFGANLVLKMMAA